MPTQALGILETRGLVPALAGADAMLKAADITLIGRQQTSARRVSILIRGDVASVRASIEAGEAAAGVCGEVLAAKVISRPHPEVEKLLPTLG